MSAPEPKISEMSGEFLPRLLRMLAIVCLAYGITGVLDIAFHIGTNGFSYSRFGPSYFRFQGIVEILYGGLNVLLVVAAIALLRWKAWSRITLVVWASSSIVLGVLSNVNWMLYDLYQRRAATTTQSHFVPVTYYLWFTFSNMLTRSAFPAMVIFILLQPQVVKLWAKATGGFEVVPFATAVPEQSESP